MGAPPSLQWGMRAWVNGQLLDDPSAPAVTVSDHGLTVGDGVFEAVKVVDDQPFALTLHLERLKRSAAGLGLPEYDEGAGPQGRRGGAGRGRAAARPAADHVHRRAGADGLRPRGRAADARRGGGADGQDPPTTTVATVPWPRNERGALAGLKTTSYAENVVALAEAKRRGATEAVFANLAGHLCEGTGQQRLLRRRRRAAYADPRERLPGRRHPRAGPGVVRRARGRRADRGAGGGQRDLPGLDHPRRPGRRALGRPRPRRRPGPVTAEALATWRRREPELLGV